jgi:7-cyano-7-deazaguanine synthase
MESKAKKIVVLLSGGMDSAVCLARARKEKKRIFALTFDYGQRHRQELQAARRLARTFGVEQHLVLRLNLRAIGASALTSNLPVPERVRAGEIPATYVPARNLIFLSVALAWAEALGAQEIFIGVNQVDFSGYPDCRGDFIRSFQQTARLATRVGRQGRAVKIQTPLLKLDKAGIIRLGIKLGVDFSKTHTCYNPDRLGRACGRCPSCRLRKNGFARAGLPDPTIYSRSKGESRAR